MISTNTTPQSRHYGWPWRGADLAGASLSDGILTAIGDTPLIPLKRLFGDAHFRVFAKLEALNPGGSMKDRASLGILTAGIEAGKIWPETVIIESSSGNMGIGLAQACAYLGLRFICVVDKKTTAQNISILKAYGAEVDMVTQPDPQTGEYLRARIDRVQTLLREVTPSFWPNQYANLSNPLAHRETIREIITALDGRLDYLFCSVSTCGTLRGCAEYLREHKVGTKVVAVDAVGSMIYDSEKSRRLIPGHGAAMRPGLYRPDLADQCVLVSDLDCVIGCRRLVQQEAILAGGSSGGVITAVGRLKDEIAEGAFCAIILPDRGERYLDTIYSDSWVAEHFGPAYDSAAEDGGDRACQYTTTPR